MAVGCRGLEFSGLMGSTPIQPTEETSMPVQLFAEGYAKMKANRPIPWLGMPVCYGGIWMLVSCASSYKPKLASTGMGITLSSYRSRSNTNAFKLPGEPDAPPMSASFISRVSLAYAWADKRVRRDGDLWVEVPLCSMHEALILPHGWEMRDLFPNNGEVKLAPCDLKMLNTDGRVSCAKCSKLLVPLWIGNTNLSYCSKCEP